MLTPADIAKWSLLQTDTNGNVLAPVWQSDASMGVIGDSRESQSVNLATTPLSTVQAGFIAMAVALSGCAVNIPDAGWQATGGQRITTGTATSDTAPMSVQVTNAIASGIRNWTIGAFGTNDFDASLGPVQTVAAVIAEYLKQLKRLLAAGCRVFVCTDPSVRTTEAASTSKARQISVLTLNHWIRQLEYAFPAQVRVIDLHAVMVVANSTTASATTAQYYDSVHFLTSGSYYGAKEIARVWNTVWPAPSILPRNNYDNYTLDSTLPIKSKNNLFQIDTNADGIADGWNAQVAATGITSVMSIAAAPAGYFGSAQHIAVTATQTGFPKWQSDELVTNFSNGTSFIIVGAVAIGSPVNVTAPRVKPVANVQASGATCLEFGGTFVSALPEGNTFVYATHPMTKDSTFTTLKIEVALQFLGAGSCTLDLMQFAAIALQ